MTAIAIINIAGATNRRDIIRRLMDASEAFANMPPIRKTPTMQKCSEQTHG